MASIAHQLDELSRGVAEIISTEDFERKLKASLQQGRPLQVKLGVDPTGSDLTLGHTVVLRKLRQFQDFGHQVTLVIGDFTGRVGDPSGKNEARRQLSEDEVARNAATYLEQVGKVLDLERLIVRRNSEWLAPLNFADVVGLASQMTVARMLEREDFAKRYAEERPIHLHEFLYPLMQGYDSVALQADVELGGMDQKFNLLVGRQLQRDAGQDAQVCFLMPLLVGTDGVEKMGKSLGNYIGINEAPNDMYGKVMSIPDNVMIDYYTLVTDVPMAEIRAIEAGLADGTRHPRDVKMHLAHTIVRLFHGTAAADDAAAHFRRVFQQGDVPEKMPDVVVPGADLAALTPVRLVMLAGFAPSNSEARRLVTQGAVSLDGVRLEDPAATVAVQSGQVLRVGKRRFGRLRVE